MGLVDKCAQGFHKLVQVVLLTNRSVRNYFSAEMTATGHAVFKGYFIFFWKPPPKVAVGKTFPFRVIPSPPSGTINDPLYLYPGTLPIWVEYSDFSSNYYNFGDKTLIQYMKEVLDGIVDSQGASNK